MSNMAVVIMLAVAATICALEIYYLPIIVGR